MEKQTINFGTSTSYKAPKCKTVELQINSALMQLNPGSYGDEGRPGVDGDFEDEGEL